MRHRLEAALVVVAALGLALVWLRPLPVHAGERLPIAPGTTIESDVHLWTWGIWWAGEALEEGRNPFYCDVIFHPEGHSLALHTHGMLWMVAAIPLARFGGVVLAHNVMLFVLIGLSALATWALARTLGLGRVGSAFATFGWVFAPYFLQKAYYHLCFVASPWPPLALLFLLGWMGAERGRARVGAACATGAALGLCALTSTTTTIYTLACALLVVAVAPNASRASSVSPRRGLRSIGAWAAGVLVALVVAAPLLVEGTRELRSILEGTSERGPVALADVLRRDKRQNPRLADFFGLPERHPLSARRRAVLEQGFPAQDDPWEGRGLTVSVALLALAAYGSTRSSAARRWALVGAGLFVLAWDPGGALSQAYRSIPPLAGLRFVTRALPLALLPLALSAGIGARELSRAGRRVPLAAAGALLLAELWVAPLELEPVPVPRAVETIARSERPGAVLDVPFGPGSRLALTWQTVHERPVLVSYLARPNPFVLTRLMSSYPALRKLLAPRIGSDGGLERPSPAALAEDLGRAGVGHVLLRLDQLRPELAQDMTAFFDSLAGWERGESGPRVLLWTRTSGAELVEERDEHDGDDR